MVASFPATSNVVESAALSTVLDAPNSTFSLLYCDIIGRLDPTRNLLALGDATWTQLYADDWFNPDLLDKRSTPFEFMPVLYVHSEDGSQTVTIAESKAIEFYLAERFGCLGRNSYERSLINAFVSSSVALFDNFVTGVLMLKASPEVIQAQAAIFAETKIPDWIRIHEEHLKANGSNGHYVGNQISLADIRTANLVGIFLQHPSTGHLITPETAPGLLKVKEAIDTHPKIVQWRETPLFKSLRPNRDFPALPRPDCIKPYKRNSNHK
ncbi:hypothetical protein BGZ99_008526 [Dissophora globulifera]|uniref:Glutathione S-transferase n=1 Tax=Dissophora globulifera TaxID=979702 RepID=A0A9P6UPJ7_9FUNG|nr:hypothetical protein BGZ99_008526 [Dissophora globulifera]